MKRLLATIILLGGSVIGLAQQAPITQTEYVRMLYALEKTPGTRADIVDALRKRGIDFTVTDGLRSLTRSKGANDEDLKRALEEADRRRQDPAAAQPVAKEDASSLLAATTKNTLAAVGEMPDFVVKQQIQRSWAFAGTNNYKNLDRLVVAVSYRSTGEESYKVLSMNGLVRNDAEARRNYSDTGGTTSTGEFVSMLAVIFKPESQTKFEVVDSDVLRGRRTLIFDFSIERAKAQQTLTYSGRVTDNTAWTGVTGRLWIDRDEARVLRIESEATEIPVGFPIQSARRTIDYDWVRIEGERYLLPSLSNVRLITRESVQAIENGRATQATKSVETRNVIRFKEYQKYGTEVKILDDDIKPEPGTPGNP
jgi:hypothetical protein